MKWIVSGSYDKTVRVWNVDTCREHHQFSGHRSQINDVSFAPSGEWVVSVSQDQTLKIWKLATGEKFSPAKVHVGPINTCHVSPNGLIATGGSSFHFNLFCFCILISLI
jgi:WD40 repeat protein